MWWILLKLLRSRVIACKPSEQANMLISFGLPRRGSARFVLRGCIRSYTKGILPAKYVAAFSGQTDAPGVRFDLTDKQQTDKHTDRVNYSNPRCACALGLMSMAYLNQILPVSSVVKTIEVTQRPSMWS